MYAVLVGNVDEIIRVFFKVTGVFKRSPYCFCNIGLTFSSGDRRNGNEPFGQSHGFVFEVDELEQFTFPWMCGGLKLNHAQNKSALALLYMITDGAWPNYLYTDQILKPLPCFGIFVAALLLKIVILQADLLSKDRHCDR